MENYEEFQDYIENLKPLDFEKFVYDSIVSVQQLTNVEIEVKINNRQIDIAATKETGAGDLADKKIIFEIKAYKRPIQLSVLDAALSKLEDVRQINPDSQLILVSANGFSKDTVAKAERLGVSLWGPKKLYGLVVSRDFDIRVSEAQTGGDNFHLNRKVENFLAALDGINPGKSEWSKYQSLVVDIIEFLFSPPLDSPKIELADQDKRNRRDIIFENPSMDGFWRLIRENYQGHYIVVDAKNYAEKLEKRPVLDISHYLKPYGCGLFAIIVSRFGYGEAAQHAAKEQWIGGGKLIVSLSDIDIRKMLELKRVNMEPEEVVRNYISEFRMSL